MSGLVIRSVEAYRCWKDDALSAGVPDSPRPSLRGERRNIVRCGIPPFTAFLPALKRLKAAALIAREQRAGAETKLELDN